MEHQTEQITPPTPVQVQDKLMSLTQAADILGIATQTARNWLLEGRFPVRTHKIGYRRMVKKSEIEQYLASL
jgi:excisionase family DNA binding protein